MPLTNVGIILPDKHNCVDDVAAMFPLIEVCLGLTDAVVRILEVRTHVHNSSWVTMYAHAP